MEEIIKNGMRVYNAGKRTKKFKTLEDAIAYYKEKRWQKYHSIVFVFDKTEYCLVKQQRLYKQTHF